MRLLHGWALLHCQLDSAGHVLRAAGSASKRESLAFVSQPTKREEPHRSRSTTTAGETCFWLGTGIVAPRTGAAQCADCEGRRGSTPAEKSEQTPESRFPRTAGDWTRRPRCLPHELWRSRRPILWQRHRADEPVPVIKDRQTLTGAEDANRARAPRVKERQRRLDLHSLRQVRTPSSHPGDPSPAATKSTVTTS